MKTINYLLPVLVTLVSFKCFGETLYSPSICPGQASLKLINLNSTEQGAGYLFRADDGQLAGDGWKLQKNEVKEIGSGVLPGTGFFLKTTSPQVLAVQVCDGTSFTYSTSTSPFRRWVLNPSGSYKFFVQNINPYDQTIMLRFLDSARRTIKTQKLVLGGYLSTSNVKFALGAAELEVSAEGRIAVQLTEIINDRLSPVKEGEAPPVKISVDPTASYFLMVNSKNTDSFVVKMTDPTLIGKARDLIAKGSWQLMVAEISYQPRSENRSLLSKEKVPFSWHVEKVVNFNDFAHISCDGSPDTVEEQIYERLKSKRICFWTYHLGRELTAQEVQYGFLNP